MTHGIRQNAGVLSGRGLRIYKLRAISWFRDEGIELTFDQFVIMQILSSCPDIIQQDLANRLQKNKSIIVRQVNCLPAKDLMTRHPGEEDKRERNLVLTKKGKRDIKPNAENRIRSI